MKTTAHKPGETVAFKWQDGRNLTGQVKSHKWIRTPKGALGLIYTIAVGDQVLAVAGQRVRKVAK